MCELPLFDECQRRKREDIEKLGPRPGWWRPFARSRYDALVHGIHERHDRDLVSILTQPTQELVHLHAVLLGYEEPTPLIIS